MNKILLLHGWGFPAAVYAPLIKELSEEYEVLAPDRSGYGGNIASRNERVSHDLNAPALVVGWSLGAQHAMQLALSQNEMVKALILIAATPCFVNSDDWQYGMQQTVFDDFRQQVKDDSEMAMQQFVRLNGGRKPDKQTATELRKLSKHVSVEALNQELTELAEIDLRSTVLNIKIPVLLLHATDDRIVPAAASAWLSEQMPNAKRIEYEAGGHTFFLQQTDVLATHVRAMA